MYPVAYQTLTKDVYVHNVFRVDLNMLVMTKNIKAIEKILAQGGLYYKPWIISGQDVPEQFITVQLPNTIGEDKERCLWVNQDVRKDLLYVKANLEEPSKRASKSDI